jgi:hypothetical protein
MHADHARSPSAVTRRTALAGLGSSGDALSTNAHQTATQAATATAIAGHPLVGTRIVGRNLDDPSEMTTINVLSADGGLIDPTVGAAGVWETTGERTANYTLTGFFMEGGGGYFLVRGLLEVDAAGETATAAYAGMAMAPDGTVLDREAPTIGRRSSSCNRWLGSRRGRPRPPPRRS